MDLKKVNERIELELSKIDNKENNVFFFVIDTKGNPSGSLEYIYKLAYFVSEEGYNVTMLYQRGKDEDEFVGVGEWLGEKYSNLPHKNVADGDLNVSPSDIMFIPEIFSNIMVQTKKLPCKRIAILQNYNFLLEQMPFSVQWGDLGIMNCITNTENNARLITDIFPYVKTTVIKPYIDEIFGTTKEPKKMVVNIVCKNQEDINKIIKPFYWKYPMYKWVSFRELRGLSKADLASALRESEITIWCDDDSSFGYTPLEAMKSGNVVICKTTNETLPWYGEENDCCLWFTNFNDVQKIIASVVRAIITDDIPEKISKDANDTLSKYSKDTTKSMVTEYINNVISNRRNEIASLMNNEK